MSHLSEEQLVLHYYGEDDSRDAERHLTECNECRLVYGALLRVLNTMDSVPAPERGPDYGADVWGRLQPRLPAPPRLWLHLSPWRWAAAAAVFALLLSAAFLAGRFYPRPPGPVPLAGGDPQAPERILLAALDDFLERSQMVLSELANADPKRPLDISPEQERASGLVSENRLYRQTAAHTGDLAVASVLDELDRVLLDITHAPSRISPAQLEALHQRLKAEGILFEIRVLGSNVRSEEEPAARRRL